MLGLEVLLALITLAVTILGAAWAFMDSVKKALDEGRAENDKKFEQFKQNITEELKQMSYDLKHNYIAIPVYQADKHDIEEANSNTRTEVMEELREIKRTFLQAVNNVSSRIDAVILNTTRGA